MRRAVLLLAVLVLAACGGGNGDGGGGGDTTSLGPRLTKSEYEVKLQSIGKEVGKRLGDTLSATKKNSPKQIQAAVKGIRQFAVELEAVNPPEEVEKLHRDLIDGIRGFADELPGIADKLEELRKKPPEEQNPSEVIQVVLGSKNIQKLTKVQQEFNKLGYKIELST